MASGASVRFGSCARNWVWSLFPSSRLRSETVARSRSETRPRNPPPISPGGDVATGTGRGSFPTGGTGTGPPGPPPDPEPLESPPEGAGPVPPGRPPPPPLPPGCDGPEARTGGSALGEPPWRMPPSNPGRSVLSEPRTRLPRGSDRTASTPNTAATNTIDVSRDCDTGPAARAGRSGRSGMSAGGVVDEPSARSEPCVAIALLVSVCPSGDVARRRGGLETEYRRVEPGPLAFVSKPVAGVLPSGRG